MATALRRLTFHAWKGAPRISQLHSGPASTSWRRQFSAAPPRWYSDNDKPSSPTPKQAAESAQATPETAGKEAPVADASASTEANAESKQTAAAAAPEAGAQKTRNLKAEPIRLGGEEDGWQEIKLEQLGDGRLKENFSAAEFEKFEQQLDKLVGADVYEREKVGFWAEGESDIGPDEEFHGDDISSHGHGELEQHREMRHYARIAAWEMPLLSKFAQTFEPPSKNAPLRFRYTTYMGEQHPAMHKVVVEFCPSDLESVTPAQVNKLIKLLGPRYNPTTEIAKISCESFPSQAQNKRYLVDLVNTLITEAKDTKDTFEDVPFDFRHHKPKRRVEFPKEWLLTPERKQYLAQKRVSQLKSEEQSKAQGKLLDGVSRIEEELVALQAKQPTAEAISATTLAASKGGAKGRARQQR